MQVGTPLFIAAENHTGGAEYLVCSFNIKKPEDLLGKKIAAGGDPANSMNWMEWTDQLGIPNDIEKYENYSMNDFLLKLRGKSVPSKVKTLLKNRYTIFQRASKTMRLYMAVLSTELFLPVYT